MRFPILAVLLFVGFAPATPGTAADLCPVPSAANAYNVTVDCTVITIFNNDYVGYDTNGAPCASPGIPCTGNQYGWSISNSSTDPDANTGALAGDPATLYLWYRCNLNDGMSAAEFDLAGSLNVISFTPLNGYLNAGNSTQLLLAIAGCPDGPVLAGAIEVESPVSVEDTSFGRIKALYRE